MRNLFAFLLLVVALTLRADACFWNNDVYFDDRNGAPPLEAILSGRWERHSDFYYDHVIRTQDAKRNVPLVPGQTTYAPADYNELAVACARRGAFDQALAMLDERDARQSPAFAAQAIRGTVLLAKNDLDSGIVHLENAIRLRRNDPAVRENFEIALAKYRRLLRDDPSLADREPTFVRPMLRRIADQQTDMATSDDDHASRAADAALFSAAHTGDAEVDHAIRCVCEMIRFGNPATPWLYAALGDLLRFRGENGNAYRAYRRALETGHPSPRVIESQLEDLRPRLDDAATIDGVIQAERDAAEDWVTQFRRYEDDLLRAGKEAGHVRYFADFYAAHGTGRETPAARIPQWTAFIARTWRLMTVLLAVIVVAIAKYLYARKPAARAATIEAGASAAD